MRKHMREYLPGTCDQTTAPFQPCCSSPAAAPGNVCWNLFLCKKSCSLCTVPFSLFTIHTGLDFFSSYMLACLPNRMCLVPFYHTEATACLYFSFKLSSGWMTVKAYVKLALSGLLQLHVWQKRSQGRHDRKHLYLCFQKQLIKYLTFFSKQWEHIGFYIHSSVW